MRLDQFQEALQVLNATQFEHFVFELLKRSARFTDVRLKHGPLERGVDIEAIELDRLLGRPRRWVFQVKQARVVTRDIVPYMQVISRMATQEGPVEVVLVAAGSVAASARDALAREGIQVWDAQKLANLATPDLLADYFGANSTSVSTDEATVQKAEGFRAALAATVPGRTEWSAFQRLVADILEFLYCPPLELPRYEFTDSDARNRRDILFEKSVANGFWALIRSDYAAHYVVVDAKNYAKPIPKSCVLDIAHYLKPYGCGMFALLVSRRGPSSGAAHATREQWIGGQKMIVHITDTSLGQMLELRSSGGEPQEVLRRMIADFRMSL